MDTQTQLSTEQGETHKTPLATFAPLLIVIAGICWGCVGLFVRPLEAMGFSSFQISWLRILITAAVFLGFVLIRDRSLLRVRPRDFWCFLGTGLISVVFFSACYYVTISLTSLSVAAVLLYTSPVFVLVLSRIFFGDAITPVKVLAVVLVLVGCVFVSGLVAGAPQLPLMGFLTGLGSGIGYASYSIFSRFAIQRGYAPMTVTVWTFIIAAIGAAFISAPPEVIELVAAMPQSIPIFIGLALVNAVIPYALYTIGLTYVENSRAAVIVSVEPVVAALVSVFVFGEPFAWFTAVGIVLVLIAIALLARN